MATMDSLLQVLHLGTGKSWLGKYFLHHLLAGSQYSKEITVNYEMEMFKNEAINALSLSFAFIRINTDELSVGDYHLILRVKPWLHVTDFDLVDYHPVKKVFFNKMTKQTLSAEEKYRFIAKRCFLRDAVYQIFMRKDDQDQRVRNHICSYLENKWTFYEENTKQVIEFLPDAPGSLLTASTTWKCRHFRTQTIRFSIDDHEYETTVAHPIDSFTLFEAMKDLVQKATK